MKTSIVVTIKYGLIHAIREMQKNRKTPKAIVLTEKQYLALIFECESVMGSTGLLSIEKFMDIPIILKDDVVTLPEVVDAPEPTFYQLCSGKGK